MGTGNMKCPASVLNFYLLFCIVLHLFVAGRCEDPPKENVAGDVLDTGNAPDHKISGWDIYKRLFAHKRMDHKDAVSTIVAMEGYAKQYKMINILLDNIFKVIPDAQTSLQQAGYYPGPFPENTDIKDALSRLLENVAFFGDILLRFPDMTHDVLKKHKEWGVIIEAAVVFCNQTQLYSEGVSQEQLMLVSQELGLKEKDPNYVNPFSKEGKMAQEQQMLQEAKSSHDKPKKKKDREKRKGPRLSRSKNEL
ncbi:coiled-coil domain-containing protein 134-like [Branchiostoma lanceolatum]|uniref:coiled-coil domain-containing protein 134-like n=1 Tax=Branchiostoma lanceolatum TaxID=7740 RepID=UPI003453CE18